MGKLPFLGLCIATAVGLTACQKPAETTNNSAKPASSTTASQQTPTQTANRTLKIATEGAYRPFNHTNADGSVGGFDVDIANALCAELKATCEIKAQDWEGIIPALNTKKFDVIVSAMSVTPERQGQVDFTEPYFTNSLVFLAKKESKFNPDDKKEIETHTITAQRSTISSQWLEQTHPKAQAKLYDTLDNAFMDLSAGRADAMVADKAPALAWLKSEAGQAFSLKGSEIDINDKLAIAVRKDDPLKGEINTALANIKANGTYDKIVAQHFGTVGNGTATTNASAVASATTVSVASSTK